MSDYDFDDGPPYPFEGEDDFDDDLELLMALRTIRDNPPKEKPGWGDGRVSEWEDYDYLYAVEIVSQGLREHPEIIGRLLKASERERAVFIGRRLAGKLREDLRRNPTKGEIIRELEKDWPEAREAISKSDPIPESTATRYFKACRLSHLDQDRGW
jgi:hypothetical protein